MPTGKNSQNKAVGISHGGRTTKIHSIVDGLGNPVEFRLSCGNTHDSTHAIELLGKIDISEGNIFGDKAYDSKSIRSYIVEQGVNYTISPRSCDLEQWYCEWWNYK